ncbi:MAG: S8 family serine peptidase [Muribaculaceae bacterium]|nr:S8 family serine peptidase [Muribaculaceae bacterium]
MKPLYSLTAAFFIAASISANADVLDVASQAFLSDQEIAANTTEGSAARRATIYSYTPMIVKIANDLGMADLEAYGSIILGQRGDLVLACVPPSKVARLNENANLITASVAAPSSMTMDMARAATGVDSVIAGTGLETGYTGKGVVVGFTDIGFDPNHIAFRDSEGKSRVAQFSVINEMRAKVDRYNTPEALAAYTTDDYGYLHATHVAGIMAGGYRENPYYGVAPDATIVGTTSYLYNVGILAGVEEIVNYAKSIGAPAVVNISLANTLGPHDGSTLFNQYLDRLGEEAIICVSAGNDGVNCNSLQKTFTAEDRELKSSIYANNSFSPYGSIDIWSSDNRPVEISFGIFDKQNKEFVDTFTVYMGAGDYKSYQIGTSGYFSTSYTKRAYFQPFTDHFVGYLGVKAEENALNSRYHIRLSFNYTTKDTYSGQGARYRIGFIVRGEEGQRVDLFTDGSTAFSYLDAPGYIYGNASMSVNDLACGKNVICVGMMNSRDSIPMVSGEMQSTGMTAGTISRYSSYGTLPDGRVLPQIVAPGSIISAVSTPYCERYPKNVAASAEAKDENGRTHRWALQSGTSMASPFVAGAIADLLEADPSLTVHDVLYYLQGNADEVAPKILSAKAPRKAETTRDPRFGSSGKLNVYDGLLSLLEDNGGIEPQAISDDAEEDNGPVTSIDNVAANESDIVVSQDGMIRVEASEGVNVAATIYSVDGKAVKSSSSKGNTLYLDAASLPAGIYIVDVVRDGVRKATKIALS